MTSALQRDVAIDALRGFALLGIIIVNAPFFAGPGAELPRTALDAAAFWFTAAFGMGKFFLIFSFLFGFGFSVMVARASSDGKPVAGRFFRRLLGLFAFGMLHAVFFFFGDILMLYALLGVVLWFCRHMNRKALLVASLLTGITGLALQALAVIVLSGMAIDMAAEAQRSANYLGTFWQVTVQRVRDLPDTLAFILVFNGFPALSMFLLGLALGRDRLFPPTAGAGMFRIGRRCFWAGAVISGAAMFLTMLWADPATGALGFYGIAAMLVVVAIGPVLSFGMALTVLGHFNRHRQGRLTHWLARAGSSSLTGYIFHSMFLSALFYGWGFGLYERLGAAPVLAIGVLTWLVAVAALNLWRSRFRYGPDEWLLRSLTDLAWKPFLKLNPDPVGPDNHPSA